MKMCRNFALSFHANISVLGISFFLSIWQAEVILLDCTLLLPLNGVE